MPNYQPGQIYHEEEHEELVEHPFEEYVHKNQKITIAALAFIFLSMAGVWMYKLNRSIHDPFVYKEDTTVATKANTSPDSESDDVLRQRDTDSDGLSDYDELRIFKTSPYLEDTDSDGFNDKQEVDSGNDPNCPQGKSCAGVSGLQNADAAPENQGSVASSSKNISDVAGDAGLVAGQAAASMSTSTVNISNSDISAVLTGAVDAASLREILLNAGMNKKQLDAINDEQLMKSYKDILSNKK